MKKTAPQSIRKRTAAKKAAFLRAFGVNGSVVRSARIAGIDRTTHYEWLAQDTKYQAAFEMTIEMAKGDALDALVSRATTGYFKPIVYKGEFQYAKRQRTLCTLADGTTAFEDELPHDARVLQRHTVTTRGEMLGVHRHDRRAILKVLELLLPEEFGTAARPKGKKAR